MLGIAHGEAADDAKALGVAVKAARVLQEVGEYLLRDMTEGWVTRVVTERSCLGGVGVKCGDKVDVSLFSLETLGEATSHLGDFERVRQAVVKRGAGRRTRDLGDAGEASECGRVEDAIAVPLGLAPRRGRWLLDAAWAAVFGRALVVTATARSAHDYAAEASSSSALEVSRR